MKTLFPTVSRLLATSLVFAVCAVRPLAAQKTGTPGPPASASPGSSDGPRLETIVFIRHAEEPANDEGQLTCQGLNRALALPDVLIARYGAPQFILRRPPQKSRRPRRVVRRRGRRTRTFVR